MLLLLHVSSWPRAYLSKSVFTYSEATHTLVAGILSGVNGHLEGLTPSAQQRLQVLVLEGKLEASLSQHCPPFC